MLCKYRPIQECWIFKRDGELPHEFLCKCCNEQWMAKDKVDHVTPKPQRRKIYVRPHAEEKGSKLK